MLCLSKARQPHPESCQAVFFLIFVLHFFLFPLHLPNAVNVKWQYFTMGKTGQRDFSLCAYITLSKCRNCHRDIDTAQILACTRCISKIPFNDMHMRDTLNCK